MNNQNKFNLKLDEFFLKLEFKKVTNDEIEAKLTQDEINYFNKLQVVHNELKQIFDKSFLCFSEHAVYLGLFISILDGLKITRETIKIEPQLSMGFDKLGIVFDVFDLLLNQSFIDTYSKLKPLTEKHFQSGSKFVNCSVIASVFFDYFFLKKVKEQFDKLDGPFKSELTDFLSDLETEIRNVHSFWDAENIKSELGNKSIIHKGKNSPKEYHFSSKELKALEESISKFLKIESELLKGSLTKENIGLLVDLITLSKTMNFAEKTLERLAASFSSELKTSLSKKALFLNDVFVIYQHPMGMTENESDNLLDKNNNYTKDTLKRQIIRNIKSLVKNLK